MKLVVLLLSIGLLARFSSQHGYFFPGAELKLRKGTLQVSGVLAESDQEPLKVTFSETDDGEPAKPYDYAEARGLPSAATSLGKALTVSFPQLPAELSPIRFTDTVTVTRVTPPICVACKCLQTAPSCTDVGGFVLVTQSFTLRVGAANPIAMGDITNLVAPNALSCVGSIPGTPPGPVANLPAVAAGTTVTLTCLVPPSPTMSSCDTNCRAATGANAAGCIAAPSSAACPQVTTPAACRTPCQSLSVGSVVKCDQAFPTVISSRPTSLCQNLRKREVDASPQAPEVDSSLESETAHKRGRLLGLGINVARITTTKTAVISGAVTATYVGELCLPSNILAAPNC